jgi:hypothetical protein
MFGPTLAAALLCATFASSGRTNGPHHSRSTITIPTTSQSNRHGQRHSRTWMYIGNMSMQSGAARLRLCQVVAEEQTQQRNANLPLDWSSGDAGSCFPLLPDSCSAAWCLPTAIIIGVQKAGTREVLSWLSYSKMVSLGVSCLEPYSNPDGSPPSCLTYFPFTTGRALTVRSRHCVTVHVKF